MRISDWSSDVCSSDLTGDGEDAVGGAADRVEVEKDDREQSRRLSMHIILDHHLKPEAQVPEDADDHRDQAERDHRVRRPAQYRAMVAERQAEERDDEPAEEQQVAERGQARLEPVASAVMRRAETAHAAEGGAVTDV